MNGMVEMEAARELGSGEKIVWCGKGRPLRHDYFWNYRPFSGMDDVFRKFHPRQRSECSARFCKYREREDSVRHDTTISAASMSK
jgi:hypothetical protein